LLKYGVRRPFAQIMTLLPTNNPLGKSAGSREIAPSTSRPVAVNPSRMTTNKGIFVPSSHAHYVGDDAEQSIF
jgi:hypothetical protein